MADSVRASGVAVCVLLLAANLPPRNVTWGKAGVPLGQYRQDAIDCAVAGYATDITNLEDTKAFVHGFSVMERSLNGGGGNGADWSDNMRLFQPNQRMDRVGQYHASVVEDCLRQRGYVKFRLDSQQAKRLNKLVAGSSERREYLYSLASNPTIISAQKID